MNKPLLEEFCKHLVQFLRGCLPQVSSQSGREKMWLQYHTIRTSKDYFILWNNFLTKSIRAGLTPIFFQFITDTMFKKLVKESYPVEHTPSSSGEAAAAATAAAAPESLTYEEQNVIRYTAGYVPRALKKKLEKSGYKNKKQLILCLIDLLESDGGIYDESQDWVKLVNRGGLIQVSSVLFLLLSAMEQEVKCYLSNMKNKQGRNIKKDLIDAINSSREVQLHWSTLSFEWGPDEARVLFEMIVELWVTMRGFSYVSAWIERHKDSTKKTTQKSKGLRKNIIND